MLQYLSDEVYVTMAEKSVDNRHGGYFERFGWDGKPQDPGFKRLRVMARQCYVFCHAGLKGDTTLYDAARAGAEFLLNKGLRPDGQFVSRLTTDGKILDATADLYDISFGLYALAWWYKISRDERAVRAAELSVSLILRDMRSPSGKGFISREGVSGYHEQNPHMHLFEALLFLTLFTKKSIFQDLLDELYTLATRTLLEPLSGFIPEFFDSSWLLKKSDDLIWIEPGHQYEWGWLLIKFGQFTERPEAIELGTNLIANTQQYGHDHHTGLLIDAIDQHGRPLSSDLRIWPNLEYLKALVATIEIGAPIHRSFAIPLDRMLQKINKHFFEPQPSGQAACLPEGFWIDYIHAGTYIPKCDHIPVSTLYHITVAFMEIRRYQAGFTSLV